jgi:adenylate cyclase
VSEDAEETSAPLADVVGEIEAFLLGAHPTLTRLEVVEQAGVPLDVAEQLWRQLGFPHRSDDDVAFTVTDVEAVRMTMELMQLGIIREDSQAALVRTWGRAYARLAEWQVALLADLAIDGPDPELRITELAATALPRVESLQNYVWRRHLASAAHRLLTEPGESEVSMAVCFVDIVGYTSHSKSLDGHELVAWIERFEQEAAGVVTDHHGRVIKTIGDEVLFTADDPADAVAIALHLTARGEDPDDDFPQVRAGIAHGNVVRRLGDVFGPTVNVAARLTTLARPGTVVTDAGVHDVLAGADGSDDGADGLPQLRWRRVRRASVKGYSRLEAWRVRPGSTAVDKG